MTAKAFDAALIEAWEIALDRRPRAVTEIELPDLPEVDSFAAEVLPVGVAVRMRCRDGSEPAFTINAVAARHLALTIFHKGVEAGWLNERGELTAPDLPPLDS
jgi:hypothetical protein